MQLQWVGQQHYGWSLIAQPLCRDSRGGLVPLRRGAPLFPTGCFCCRLPWAMLPTADGHKALSTQGNLQCLMRHHRCPLGGVVPV
jgi:hypothetical protein